jgi:CRISPR-associated protein Csb1
MRGYGLGDAANNLLTALALYKLLKTLESGLRLRTACDLEAKAIKVTRPHGLTLDGLTSADLAAAMPNLIAACGFNDSSVTRIGGQVPAKKKAKDGKAGKESDEQAEGSAQE